MAVQVVVFKLIHPFFLRFSRLFSLSVKKEAKVSDLRIRLWRWHFFLRRNLFVLEETLLNNLVELVGEDGGRKRRIDGVASGRRRRVFGEVGE